jgi:Ca2+-binding RTX toxin-like protein
MASSVTIFGSASKPVTLSFDSTANFALAAQIAARINAGIAAGTLLAESDANGPPPALPGTVSGAYFQASSGIAALPKGYAADVITKPGSAIVFGSGAAGEMILSGETTDLTFIAASGSGSVVAGGGNDRIVVGGTGNWSLSTGNGNDIISAVGTGSATVSAGGGNNAILLGPGKAVVTSAGDDTIYGGTGAETPAICCSSAAWAVRRSWAEPAATRISVRTPGMPARNWSPAGRKATITCSRATGRPR